MLSFAKFAFVDINTIMKKKYLDILCITHKACNGILDAICSGNQCKKHCGKVCEGEKEFKKIINRFISVFESIEPECCRCLSQELENIRPNIEECLNFNTLSSIRSIVKVLQLKYLEHNANLKKIFISHASKDECIVKPFIKELLKIGCGLKDGDIFCTLNSTVIRTGDDFREKIVENMRQCDFILLFISQNYLASEICLNEMGAAWALKDKRVLPFVLPGNSFDQMGVLNEVKQGALITDKKKLDEFYAEICDFYSITPDWLNFNNAKEDYIESIRS